MYVGCRLGAFACYQHAGVPLPFLLFDQVHISGHCDP
jgi:hypothetical protein